MKVSYLGPKGSFSEIALSNYFRNNITAIPMESLGDVFQAVEKNESTYGVIPIENSIEGSVNNSHDLLMESSVLINGEIDLPINQCLLSKNSTKENINTLYSHSQSLAQCQNWIKSNLQPDQLILEFHTPGEPNSGWIHCSWIPDQPRASFLWAYRSEGKTKYKPILGKAKDLV